MHEVEPSVKGNRRNRFFSFFFFFFSSILCSCLYFVCNECNDWCASAENVNINETEKIHLNYIFFFAFILLLCVRFCLPNIHFFLFFSDIILNAKLQIWQYVRIDEQDQKNKEQNDEKKKKTALWKTNDQSVTLSKM